MGARRGSGKVDRTWALLPLREMVVLPGSTTDFLVGRAVSIAALDLATARADREILLVAQRDASAGDPAENALHETGTIARVSEVTPLPDGKRRAVVEGLRRVCVGAVRREGGALIADVRVPDDAPAPSQGTVDAARAAFSSWARAARVDAGEVLAVADPGRFADAAARMANLGVESLQAVLDASAVELRLTRLTSLLRALPAPSARDAASPPAPQRAGRARRDEDTTERDGLAELEAQVAALLPPVARARAERELRTLRAMNPASSEASVTRNWLEQVLAMPWGVRATERIDLGEARAILEADHRGLHRVKARILEHLAVMKLRGEQDEGHPTVLCLVGPPGVGKTSLARSIARATGRPFARVALGGVRDEAEIRGHRRTYVGAMPGRIVAGLKRAGAVNPVFLLDEIDKLASDVRGDPASALLEVLDPEQNTAFSDHYLELDVDLSHVLFVCTANSTASIPAPLLDRLEVVRIGGYTEQEKVAIAREHLLPERRAAAGLRSDQLEVTRAALVQLVRGYTREAGVRSLDRELGAICRKVARRVVEHGPATRVRVDTRRLEGLLGAPRHRHARIGTVDERGFVSGLAWTSAGGVVVPIEASAVHGSGKTTMTGQLGSVFRESCEAAITYIRTRADSLGLPRDAFSELDVHVHVPELWGVDGPSAGITLTTALVSAVCGLPVRRDVAMTGEITLRGHVRPIGGVKEKLLAASQAGVRRVLLPRENARDLDEVPRSVRAGLDVRLVDHMDEVLVLALAVDGPEAIFRGPATIDGDEPPTAAVS